MNQIYPVPKPQEPLPKREISVFNHQGTLSTIMKFLALATICITAVTARRPGRLGPAEKCLIKAILPRNRCQPELNCELLPNVYYGYCKVKDGQKCTADKQCARGSGCVNQKCVKGGKGKGPAPKQPKQPKRTNNWDNGNQNGWSSDGSSNPADGYWDEYGNWICY